MIVYPDTSFLCAIYRNQVNSPQADGYLKSLRDPPLVTALLLFEFRQSVRLQTFLHRSDASKGYGEAEGGQMLDDLQCDLATGILQLTSIDWAAVISVAENLSVTHTSGKGNRSFDVLHVATALVLNADVFVTFDARLRTLAKAARMKVKP
jgi:predicted nucleic acid-binding protein